jgi:iron complex outermembrane recepter protein
MTKFYPSCRRVWMTSAAIAAITISTAPAVAQQADSSAAPAGADEQGDDIVVTGIRGSIQRAQDLKRDSAAVIESITSEDLGKFSDQNLADALQRVPGVQIERNDSGRGGDRTAIRGLGSQYVQVTVNQRTLVSYGNAGAGDASQGIRSFNLDAVPTEVTAGLTVFKTPLAQNIEPGLGGLLNLQTLRPLDYKAPPGKSDEFFGSATIRGEVDNIASVIKPRYSGAVGAKLFDNTLGIFVSGVIADTVTRTDQLNAVFSTRDLVFANPAGGTTTVEDVFTPDTFDTYAINYQRKRRTGTVALQWKPDDRLDVNLDFTYNKYDNNQERQRNSLQAYGSLYSGVLDPSQVTVTNGAVTAFTPLRGTTIATNISPQSGFEINETTTKYGGANVLWKGDGWNLSFDYGHSDVEYRSDIQVAFGENLDVPISYSTVNGLPNFTIGTVPTDIEAYFYFLGQTRLRTARDAFRIDTDIELTSDLKFRAGARYENTTVDSRAGAVFSFLPRALQAFNFGDPTRSESFGSIPLDREQTFTPAEQTALDRALVSGAAGFSTFPEFGLGNQIGTNIAGFCTVATRLCGLNIAGGSLYSGPFPTTSVNDGTNDINLDPGNSYFTKERNIAFYGQFEGSTALLGGTLDGNLGLRAVRIDLQAQAFAAVRRVTRVGGGPTTIGETRTATIDDNGYWEFLPNLNMTFHPTSNINLRFGVARSISLPQYETTAPTGTVSVYDRNYPPPCKGEPVVIHAVP